MTNDQIVAPDAAPVAPKAARWEDIIDVFISPVELFQRRAHDRVAPSLLTLIGLAIVVYFAMLPANGILMRASVASNPEAAAAMAGRMGTVFQIVGSIMVPITYLVILALTAAIIWIVSRFADVRMDFSRAMLIATFGGFIFLLANIAQLTGVLIHGEAGLDIVRDMSFGPLRFIGSADMDKLSIALLSRLDVFSIWQAAIWAIGVKVIYNVSTMRAGVIAAATWVLFTVPSLAMIAISPGTGPS